MNRTARWRLANPHRAAYINLKAHAKARSILFTLTFAGFLAIPRIDEYVLYKGAKKKDLTIDRIDPRLGYANGNCQVMTREANSKKRWTDPMVFDPRFENNDIEAPF